MITRLRSILLFALRFCAYTYLAALFGWFVTRAFFGDRWWWLFLLNVIAPYLFLPIPLILLSALPGKRIELWLFGCLALLLGLYLYGGLLIPRLPAAHAAEKAFVVMTSNVLVNQTNGAAVVRSIRESNADVVALQELNVPIIEAIRQNLAGEYPYQVLSPEDNASGMGVISRYPLQVTNEQLSGHWLGKPQVLQIDLEGTTIILVNVHCISINLAHDNWQQNLELGVYERERAAEALAGLASRRKAPLIVVGDFNTTDQTQAYHIINNTLRDAWREAGFGTGHTFPGPYAPFGGSPSAKPAQIPVWLARIDYIFYSNEWRILSARNGPENGGSDHRPVIAEFVID